MEQKFFLCTRCGGVAELIGNEGAPASFCGEDLKELVPGTTEGAQEKHIPVYEVEGNTVKVRVGSVDHPMLPEHYIAWISLQTKQGSQRKLLRPGDPPAACFALCGGDEVEAVYAYCNLHSLWKG